MTLLQQIQSIIQEKHLLKHPFYRDWMEGKLSLDQLKNYAFQYTPFVDAFPRFVSSTHSLCEDSTARQMLLENLMDEEGKSHSEPHPQLWRDFESGIPSNVSNDSEPYAQELRDTFFELSRSSFEEAIGALYAYESQIPEIAKAKIEGLIKHYEISDTKTLKFFQVHEAADVYHSQACEKIINSIDDCHREKTFQAVTKATEALWKFLSHVHG